MNIKNGFEGFMKEMHADVYLGLDDEMSDAYDDWITNITPEEWMDFAESFAEIIAGSYLPR